MKIPKLKKIKKQEIYNILFFKRLEEKDAEGNEKSNLVKIIKGVKKYRETRKGLKLNTTLEKYKKLYPLDYIVEIKKVREYEIEDNA